MRIQINGEQREFPETSLTLKELIEALSLAPQRIAVEVNQELVSRARRASRELQDGDRIELVTLVGDC